MVVASAVTDNNEDDDFQSIPKKAALVKKKRLYIGNLPVVAVQEDLTEALQQRQFLQRAIAERTGLSEDAIDVELVTDEEAGTPPHALITILATTTTTGTMSLDEILNKLRGMQWHGKKLLIQREQQQQRRKNQATTNNKQPSSFATGRGGWAKPSTVVVSSKKKKKSNQVNRNDVQANPISTTTPTSPTTAAAAVAMGELLLLSEHATAIVVEECTEPKDDTLSSTTAATALDFYSLCQTTPLSSLLDDYGAHDPDWMNKVQPQQLSTIEDSTTLPQPAAVAAATTEIQSEDDEEDEETVCRLQRHGKAPIHVEFTSFGYRHGMPAELRYNATGNSHRQPLPVYDCRSHLAPVPHFLAWMDGLSGAVKNSMLRYRPDHNNSNNNHHARGKHNHHHRNDRQKSDTTTAATSDDDAAAAAPAFMPVRDYARDVVAAPVAEALSAAMCAGHGYSSPLQMTVHIGSEQGRHRSVVAAELAATALRKLLRANRGNRFQCAVSVGCRHRDIDQPQPQQSRPKQQQHKNNSNSSSAKFKKQKDLEDD